MRLNACLLLAALVSTTAAATAAAPANPAPTSSAAQARDGVWTGTLGTSDITVCLRGDEQHNGAYYYHKHLQPIQLNASAKSGAATLIMSEQAGAEPAKDAPVWQLELAGAGKMSGTWRAGAKQLPIQLAQLPLSKADRDDGACSSNTYNAALEKPARVASRKARFGGAEYELISLDFSKRFSAEISSFALAPTGAGVVKVNAALRKNLMAEQHNVFACSRAAREAHMDADYNSNTTPEWIASGWLVTVEQADNFCGGAHPNYGQSFATWNLERGEAVDPWTWFNATAVKLTVRGAGTPSAANEVSIQPVLRSRLARGWADVSEPDCADGLSGSDQQWQVRPVKEGMAFTPYLPHALTACVSDVVIPYAKLGPLLNQTGAAIVASLRAGAARK